MEVNKEIQPVMRIDKFLWSTRYFKTRNIATTACKKGHAKIVDIYRKDTTPKEAFEHNELLQYSKDYYRKKGIGRPTKKDRRDIDDYLETPSKNDESKTVKPDNNSKEVED